MLETALLASGIALFTSAGVVFLTVWEMRVRLRRLEMQLAEWEERLVREVKQRAAAASVAARKLPNPLDEALIRQHTGQEPNYDSEGTPWWDGLVRK